MIAFIRVSIECLQLQRLYEAKCIIIKYTNSLLITDIIIINGVKILYEILTVYSKAQRVR